MGKNKETNIKNKIVLLCLTYISHLLFSQIMFIYEIGEPIFKHGVALSLVRTPLGNHRQRHQTSCFEK